MDVVGQKNILILGNNGVRFRKHILFNKLHIELKLQIIKLYNCVLDKYKDIFIDKKIIIIK